MKHQTKFKQTEIGMIPEDWKVKEFGDFIKVQNGFAFKSLDFKVKGIPIIKIKNITPPTITFEEVQYYNEDIDDKLKPFILQKGDVIISMTGSNVNQMASAVGKVARYKSDLPALLNQRAGKIIIDSNIADSDYIYFYIARKEIQYYLAINASGSANQANISPDTIKSIPIALPSLSEQRVIAKILSDLDKKIELNQRMNKTLEAIAQAIFKHWFIDFEFPNENGEPYKSYGGEMVDSEIGLIPKRWKIVRLDKLIKRNKQKIKNTKDWENNKLIDLSIMPRFSFCVNNFEKGSKLKTNIYKLNKFDILFGSIRPYFGKAGFSPINGVVTGTIFSYLPVEENSYSYILCLTTNKSFINFTVKYSRGTKMPIIHWDDFVSYKVVVPEDDKLLESFNNMIMPLLKEIKVNINLNQDLSDMRDILLPKLMSGEIRVPINSKVLISKNN